MDNPSFEICFHLFGYQKRCWWMLSSISQQIKSNGHEIPRIIVKLNVMSKLDPYADMTKKMIKTFDPLVELKIKEYDDKKLFEKRGPTRNSDIEECSASWIFFSDVDMIFHPEFFSDISANYIHKWEGTGKVVTGPRIDVNIVTANTLVNSFEYENNVIENAFDICWNNRGGYSHGGLAPGAGYFQLVEIEYLKKNNILYCAFEDLADRSVFDEKGGDTRSDRKFREKCRGVIVVKKRGRIKEGEQGSLDILKPFLHLNHYKRYDKKKYIEEWTPDCK